jgi:hypothetical protein
MKLGVTFHDSQIIDIQSDRRKICKYSIVKKRRELG